MPNSLRFSVPRSDTPMTSARAPIGYGAVLFQVASSTSGRRVPSSSSSPVTANVRSPVRCAPSAVNVIVGFEPLSRKSRLFEMLVARLVVRSDAAGLDDDADCGQRARCLVERVAAARGQELA